MNVHAVWREFHGPLLGFAVALVLAVAGRFLRIGVLAAIAGGAGVLIGWYEITGQLWVVAPRLSVDDLMPVAVASLVIGLFAARAGSGRTGTACTVLAALFAGWWLSGAPRDATAFHAAWPLMLAVGVAVLLVGHVLTRQALDPPHLALVGLTLAGSLFVVAAPQVWIDLALTPGLVALALLALPAMPGPAALPVAADSAAVACLAVLVLGRLPRLGLGRVDVAALSPLLALWLVPYVAARARFAGRVATLAGSVLAGAIAVGAVWAASRLIH